MKRRSRFLITLVMGASLVSGADASEIKTMLTGDPRSFMPGGSPDDYTTTLLQHVYEGLVAWRSDGSVATAWGRSPTALLEPRRFEVIPAMRRGLIRAAGQMQFQGKQK